ncbi:MAG: ParB N-terminal domain-containing protein, partial [Candidatus Odinarchaeota archaeon]
MITFSFDNRVWRVEFPSLNADFKVEFNVSDIDRIVEHETTVSDKTVINKLLESVSSEGFLHPVLVTEHRGVYVIADGTHRLFALRELALKKDCRIHVPLNILREPYFKRDSWVFYFNSRI